MIVPIGTNKAVDECIHEGILEKFLRENRAEVIAVSIFEYNKEEEEQKLRKAEYEAGVVKGELKKARETDWAKNSHMEAKFEVKKAAIEIRYIDFQIYICYNAYRQERIIV